MGRFRLKADPVEARCLTKDLANEVAIWCGGLLVTEIDPVDPLKTFVGINVPTQNGLKRASQGDWIVKSHGGSFFTVPSSEFLDRYEQVDG